MKEKQNEPQGCSGIFCFLNYAALPCLLIVLWAVLSALNAVNSYLVPSPARIWSAALRLIVSGELGGHIAISLARVLGGYGISVVCALPLALLFHENLFLRRLFHGLFEMIRAVPPLALIPLLILWFGLGESSNLAVIVLAAFFPVFLNAENGFDSMDSRWLELSRSLELSFPRHLFSVLIPASLPQIITGLRLGFGYAWRALLGAELFASASGLGYLITDSQAMARVDRVFVGIITIGLLGTAFDALLRFAARKLITYDPQKTGREAV
ncbi:MAG: ABC transporter permease [Spirochaetaceae bacterium]|jgi:NitT/TauT family transport system permease protein/sulfonate transport system permease protein|nr:ABC transporter permease [Spirochaetaceae bacterium]